MWRRLLLVLVALAAVGVTGCATAPMAGADLDQAAKTFAVAPGKANIYLYRNESFGAAISMDVLLDGKPMGSTAAKTYFRFEVDPGKHTLLSKSENDASVDLTVAAGRNYFVWQEVKMGLLYARNLLNIVDEPTGRAGVMECKLIGSAAK